MDNLNKNNNVNNSGLMNVAKGFMKEAGENVNDINKVNNVGNTDNFLKHYNNPKSSMYNNNTNFSENFKDFVDNTGYKVHDKSTFDDFKNHVSNNWKKAGMKNILDPEDDFYVYEDEDNFFPDYHYDTLAPADWKKYYPEYADTARKRFEYFENNVDGDFDEYGNNYGDENYNWSRLAVKENPMYDKRNRTDKWYKDEYDKYTKEALEHPEEDYDDLSLEEFRKRTDEIDQDDLNTTIKELRDMYNYNRDKFFKDGKRTRKSFWDL